MVLFSPVIKPFKPFLFLNALLFQLPNISISHPLQLSPPPKPFKNHHFFEPLTVSKFFLAVPPNFLSMYLQFFSSRKQFIFLVCNLSLTFLTFTYSGFCALLLSNFSHCPTTLLSSYAFPQKPTVSTVKPLMPLFLFQMLFFFSRYLAFQSGSNPFVISKSLTFF